MPLAFPFGNREQNDDIYTEICYNIFRAIKSWRKRKTSEEESSDNINIDHGTVPLLLGPFPGSFHERYSGCGPG